MDEHKAKFMQKIHESSEAISKGNYHQAVQLYTDAILLDPSNHILYSNRSAAFIKMEEYEKALSDALQSRTLNPTWTKAYLREGVALQCLGQTGDALAAFARGLAQDPNNSSLLSAIVDSTLKSPLKDKMEPVFQQLSNMNLQKSAFVTVAVIGQELLATGHFSAAIVVLESALKVNSPSQRLQGSVFSALSSCHWSLGHLDQSLHYMQEDLRVCKALGDQRGECRVRCNLGSAHFAKGNNTDALSNHRMQLVLAMKFKDRSSAASALSSLGHVYTAMGDYPNALASHKQCVILMKQSHDKLSEARQIGNVGAVYLAVGDCNSAIECHTEHLRLAKLLNNKTEQARALSNLGSAHHYTRTYATAISYHNQVLQIAQELADHALETRAHAGLGHAARSMGNFTTAKRHHELQLDSALKSRDKVAEGRACSNLGIIFHQMKEYNAAIKLHKVHYDIAKLVDDKAGQGRALGNLGNAYSAMGDHQKAIELHEEELKIATDVNDRHSKGSTHGNLAVSYQSLNDMDSALEHYVAHLTIAQELKDTASESRALYNIGNFHSVNGNFQRALPYYEQYLAVSQELHDVEGESKACFNLGYAHYALGNFQESMRYYNQDLTIARETHNQANMARDFCNLGLVHKSLANLDEAMSCQTNFYNISTMINNNIGIFKALGNIADILLLKSQQEEALKTYNKQLTVAKQSRDSNLIIKAYCTLGAVHKSLGEFDKALGFFTQELNAAQECGDIKNESLSHGHIGNVHMSLGNYTNAYKSYTEQLECAQHLKQPRIEATAYANLGITKLNLGHYDDAAVYFEQQISIMEAHSLSQDGEREQVYANLGLCYESIGDFPEALKCYETYLQLCQWNGSPRELYRAYRSLGNVHRAMGDLQQAVVCFEKRLVIAHELDEPSSRASAYGELGCLHSLIGNYEQAVSCLEQEQLIAHEIEDKVCEGEALCGLGGVYQRMGKYQPALEYHQKDLDIAMATNNPHYQCRAYGNLGLCHESMDQYDQAIHYQQKHLTLADDSGDKAAITLACISLGRIYHAISDYSESALYLRRALELTQQLGNHDDEAKVRHRLALALWKLGEIDKCHAELVKAIELLEATRHDLQYDPEHKLSSFDLQTASFHMLQRVLVEAKREDEALLVCERCSTRALIHHLTEQHKSGGEPRDLSQCNLSQNYIHSLSHVSLSEVLRAVTKHRVSVLYYSVVMDYLHVWLITHNKGIVKFYQMSLSELEFGSDTEDSQSTAKPGAHNHTNAVEHTAMNRLYNDRLQFHTHQVMSETESEADDIWQRHIEEVAEQLNADNDKNSFLKLVNRGHKVSTSCSLNSLFNLSSGLNGLLSPKTEGSENYGQNGNLSVVISLYELLVQPLEDALAEITETSSGTPDLVIIATGDLYLVPFGLLTADDSQPFFYERFNLIISPSLTELHYDCKRLESQQQELVNSQGSLVVGNPTISPALRSHWQLDDIRGSEYEARIVAELLGTQALIGHDATKHNILRVIQDAEVIHFACNVSWKLMGLFLTAENNSISSMSESLLYRNLNEINDMHEVGASINDYLLTATDILNLKLNAKLVVLSSGYGNQELGRVEADNVVGLTQAILAAGAQCILYSLWPMPDEACKLLMRSLYSSLQKGMPISWALSQALKIVSSTKQFSHPRNWGGWMLMGQNIRICNKSARIGLALCELLQHTESCRNTLKVLLHLIEKAQQRIEGGSKNSMYMTYESIDNKVCHMPGWCRLLESVGFRTEAANDAMPCSVFFPHSDPANRLTQATTSLHALLNLSNSSMCALAKFTNSLETGSFITKMVRDVMDRHRDSSVDAAINVRLWRTSGVHEFLASLGFDLLSVGHSEVILRMGRLTNRRYLLSALRSLLAIFGADSQDLGRGQTLGSSSSTESLTSIHSSSTSTSAFSKGSSPPRSPTNRRKSLFNPAEMERMRAAKLTNWGGQQSSCNASFIKRKSLSPDPSMCLSHQTDIRSRYPPRQQPLNSSPDCDHSPLAIEYRLNDDRSSFNSSPRSTPSEYSLPSSMTSQPSQKGGHDGSSDASDRIESCGNPATNNDRDQSAADNPKSNDGTDRCRLYHDRRVKQRHTAKQLTEAESHRHNGSMSLASNLRILSENKPNIPVRQKTCPNDSSLSDERNEKLYNGSSINQKINGHATIMNSHKYPRCDKMRNENKMQLGNRNNCSDGHGQNALTECIVNKLDTFRGISPTFSIKTSPLVPPRNPHLTNKSTMPKTMKNDYMAEHKNSKSSNGKSPILSPQVSQLIPDIQSEADKKSAFLQETHSLSRSGSSSSNQSLIVSQEERTYPNLETREKCASGNVILSREKSPKTLIYPQNTTQKIHKKKHVSFTEPESDTSSDSIQMHDLSTVDRNAIYKRNLLTYSDPSFMKDCNIISTSSTLHDASTTKPPLPASSGFTFQSSKC